MHDVTPRFEAVKGFFFRCGGGGVPITKPVLALSKLYSWAGKKTVLSPSE